RISRLARSWCANAIGPLRCPKQARVRRLSRSKGRADRVARLKKFLSGKSSAASARPLLSYACRVKTCRWMRNGNQGDGLLLTAHDEGFTAVLMRGNRPLTLRSVFCDASECDDELHRLLLFYRDRVAAGAQHDTSVSRLLVVGDQ